MMPFTAELADELHASMTNIRADNAAALAARILDLIQAAPKNRALFLTLAAVALAGAETCRK